MSVTSRLHAVDALRGLAVVAILLLHNLEHFDIYFKPEALPARMKLVDDYVWDSLFFLFASKAYAIFALLFGLTFAIQAGNPKRTRKVFNSRFAWRLLLLIGFGLLNSTFFQGDILMVYAVIGFLLIPLRYLADGWLVGLAAVLLLLPPEWLSFFQTLDKPAAELVDPNSWQYFGLAQEYLRGDGFLATIAGNLTNGRKAVIIWNWEQGRYFVILAMFILGMVGGRRGLFAWSDDTRKFWQRLLLVAVVLFPFLWAFQHGASDWLAESAAKRPADRIIGVWKNLAFTVILVAGFLWLFHETKAKALLEKLIPLGKMSLSNYVFQSILGTAVYYGYGLGLWEHTGATFSLFIGLGLALFMGWLSKWWLDRFKRGPLESIWHRLTWGGAEMFSSLFMSLKRSNYLCRKLTNEVIRYHCRDGASRAL